MRDPTLPARVKLRCCGEAALLILRSDAPCRVAAVFERSFYLQAGGAMACLGNPAIDLGPLNGILDVPPGMNWRASGLRVGDRCRRSADTIYLGGRFLLDMADATPWRPEAWPEASEPISVAWALASLSRACAERAPAEGLGPVLAPDVAVTNRTVQVAQDSLAGCRQWLSDVFGRATRDHGSGFEWTHGLIGLGPGLTPSGDDFLGGIMIALHALGRPGAARHLAEVVANSSGAAGNPISDAHLAAAGDGQGHEAIHGALNYILNGADSGIEVHLDALDRIGHSSGWDTFAGVVTVLRSWLAAQDRKRRAA